MYVWAGSGYGKDLKKAFAYYKQAADEGNLAKAQFKVGKMAYLGEGTKQDTPMALKYIHSAFDNGYPTAMEFWNANQLWKYEQ